MARGRFITLEGTDGVGKSTQAALLADALEARGLEVVRLREPGGTALGERVRALLLEPTEEPVSPIAELLLFEASRAQLVARVIEPALACGAWVVCDRFYDSTTAYQQGGRGLDAALVVRANALGSCGLAPDLTLVLDMDPALAFARGVAGAEPDRMEAEGLAFERAVADAYRALAVAEPARVALVNAAGTPEQVHERVAAVLRERGLDE
ncbi:dTMP kinase [Olsenella sp. YH-ols2217]|uniref:Thymidylate kinase n=1 Tax=Kribbibacterium absianum TaxID=3044210 RepID=A0ABT6ZNV6_9ACTN|nr:MULTISPECIES: dTMP kinase [unclassified Olsenella]MDJ1122240.1 dTMP kinase [Olsenella sp. YH-ols2216]MDJ1130346.1 dTMP kinase [Olsenella sp. YH-ols2217]